MKYVFLGVFAGLVALSLVAWQMRPSPAPAGKTSLAWVSDDNPARREQIARFNELNPDLDLRLDPGNTGMQKVIVQCLAGVGPDLFDCYDGFQLSAYVRSGVAYDVTAFLREHGLDVQNDLWPATEPNIVCDGRVYGFPTNASVNALWFNKEIFDQYGLPYPAGEWTWGDFLPLARKLTVRDERGRVRHFGLMCDWWNWPQFVAQWGGAIYSPDGTRCVIDSPEAIGGIQFLHDLMYRYGVMPSPVEEAAMASTGGWGSGTIHLFAGGKAAMAVGGRWWLCTMRNTETLRLGAVPCPYGPRQVFRGYGRATLVNAKSRQRDQALRFLLYMAEQPYNDLVNHQADALAPVKRFSMTPAFLHDPDYPSEDFNAVWRAVMERGVPDQVSPFINGNRASRILNKQLDLVRNDQKPVPDALRAAAAEVNAEIQETLRRDPSLRRRYDQRLAKRGTP